ncbi:hypothetical protein FHS15_005730 [Paenibacillus castaneae]|uniref:hypothetical protein n=1 Tax=Paenibacillus TaxID=44249 RepID=UPI001122082F|nr:MULTISPECIES: hypothetical protein [Paenibacillus]NIK80540.1 hypothetical protein [Paenibacillus castaneae]
MIITHHAIQRFQERITSAPRDAVETFIAQDIKHGDFLYSYNGVEKWRKDEVTYVVERQNGAEPKVLTLYLH